MTITMTIITIAIGVTAGASAVTDANEILRFQFGSGFNPPEPFLRLTRWKSLFSHHIECVR
jgi:hypothetical protein